METRTQTDRAQAAVVVTDTFQFHPDLLGLLIETIPRLVRTKREVLLFFRGAGVPDSDLTDLMELLKQSPADVHKFGLARECLIRLNAAGDSRIRARRELLRRVVEFEDFAGCYDNERDTAKARVAEVRRLVDIKDSFTRMRLEREHEAESRRAEARRRLDDETDRRRRRDEVRRELFALFGSANLQARGRQLERVLNNLFDLEGLKIRDAFTLVDDGGHPSEQVDGAVEVDFQLYLVEMKWQARPVDIEQVSRHLVRVHGRADCGAIFIAANGFTSAAVDECRRALRDRTVVLFGLDEFVRAMESDESIEMLLRSRIRRARLDREPLARVET